MAFPIRIGRPRHRPRRIKPPRPPSTSALESSYAARIGLLLNLVRAQVEEKALPALPALIRAMHQRHAQSGPVLLVARADDEYETVSEIFNGIRVNFFERESVFVAQARVAVQQTAAAVAGQNARHIRSILERALRVDVIATEPWLGPLTRNWITENVGLIRTIAQDRLADVEKVIYRMTNEGASIADTRAAMQDRFGVSKARARLIARDQVGKYNAALTEQRQQQVGIEEYIWRNSQDVRVRGEPAKGAGGRYPEAKHSHTIMEGLRCKWADPTVYSDDGGKTWKPRTGKMPRAHPGEEIQCVPAGSVIVSPQPADVFYRRHFRGELTTLVTASGETLHATANHPVLTLDGWKPLHLVDRGEHIFKAVSQAVDGAEVNIEHLSATADDLFRAAREIGSRAVAIGTAGQFHGDGTNQDVDVVDVASRLEAILDSAITQESCENFLTWADVHLPAPGLPLRGGGQQYMARTFYPTYGFMRGAGKLLALFGREGGHSGVHGIAAPSRLNALLNKSAANGDAVNAMMARDLLDAGAAEMRGNNILHVKILAIARRAVAARSGVHAPSAHRLAEIVRAAGQSFADSFQGQPLVIEPHRVIKKSVREFSTHVYNFSTPQGWYSANGFIVHNCRCDSEPVLDRLMSA